MSEISEKLRVLDLFSGIGGFSLGLERTGGFETVAFCEIDEFCQRVLAKHWPYVRQYGDVRDITARSLRQDGIAIDVICGGFPCQPFSTASRGRRVAQDFWPEMLRVVDELGPAIVIAENVQEKAIADAGRDVEAIGYRAHIQRIGAHEGGADHTRNRWWLCAYSNDQSEFSSAFHAKVAQLSAICAGIWGATNYARAIRVPDGIPDRVDRIEALGNAVIPQIPELIGHAILQSRAAA